MYERVGSNWVFQQQLKAYDEVYGLMFGISVSMAGETLAVGAHSEKDANGWQSGTVYLYERTGGSWTFQEKLYAPDAGTGNMYGHMFGYSVSLDGDKLAVGAPGDDEVLEGQEGKHRSGAVYIFQRVNSEWVLQQELHSPDRKHNQLFGTAIQMKDGYLAVGCAHDNSFEGTVFMFELVDGDYLFQERITAPASVMGTDSLNFGAAVAFDFPTRSLAITAPRGGSESLRAEDDVGAVLFFTLGEEETPSAATDGRRALKGLTGRLLKA